MATLKKLADESVNGLKHEIYAKGETDSLSQPQSKQSQSKQPANVKMWKCPLCHKSIQLTDRLKHMNSDDKHKHFAFGL